MAIQGLYRRSLDVAAIVVSVWLGSVPAHAQLAPGDGARRGGASTAEAIRAHPDILGCQEYVRESAPAAPGGSDLIVWTGACRDGLRDGIGLLKVLRGHELLVASSGRYEGGFRAGSWLWEFPDGRRLEARFAGDGHDPLERVFESAKGERSRQLWRDGHYVTDPGVAPPPEARPLATAPAGMSNAPNAVRGKSEATLYAAAHFRTAQCAGKRRIDARSELLATRRDVDLFVREGDAALRAEIDAELQSASRALQVGAVRAAALTGGVRTNRAGEAAESTALRDRYDWVRCHSANGLPLLARMQQSVGACERVSMIRLETVRASGNPRLQAEFADCLHSEILAPRWTR